jgi:site-specific DNA recombinase
MKVAVYVRVSTQQQAQTQTIEQQLERLRQHIQQQGWSLPAEHIFRDDGYSGAHLNRPALDRLRDLVTQGEFQKVLLTAPDRLARNYVHQVLLIEELERLGCRVEFLDRPMSQDPHDQLLLQIRGAVSEYERSLIAERMRRGRLAKFRAGLLLPWPRVPYGFRVNPERPRDPRGARLDEAEAAMVAGLFAAYLLDGQSLYGLTKQMMASPAATPRGKLRWNQGTIRGILSNPLYTGKVYAGRTLPKPASGRRSALTPIGHRPSPSRLSVPPEDWILVATLPPIVSQEQFDLVQAKLAHNRQFAKRNNHAHDYLLRALVSCGLCRGACLARMAQPAYAYYLCRGKLHPALSCHDQKCLSRFIPAQALDDLVWQDVCEVLTHPDTIAQALQRAQGGHWLPQELQARREQLRKGRFSLEQQLERLTAAYLGEVIPLAEYQRRRRELEQKLQALAQQTQQLDASAERQLELAGLVTSIESFCGRIQPVLAQASFAQKRQLVELLIDRVVVNNDEVEIRYVIPTSLSSEHVRFCHLRKDYFGALPKSVVG